VPQLHFRQPDRFLLSAADDLLCATNDLLSAAADLHDALRSAFVLSGSDDL
jgi:hypothetical protein